MAETLYFYKAYVEKVYDGDTITCTIDCGFNMSMKSQKFGCTGSIPPNSEGRKKKPGGRRGTN